MKNLLFTLLLILCYQLGFTQYCDQNTILGSTINEFDWQSDCYDIYLKNEFQQVYHSCVTSPFRLDNNSSQLNTIHFALSQSIDNKPEDGWEVIYYNFGEPTQGVAEPSFALYNRYNGIFRFFMFLSANDGDPYQEAFVSTYIDKVGSTYKNSALLESMNAIHHSLEDFEKTINHVAVNHYNNSYGYWVVSEWLTHYDPCTCNSSMRLVFEPVLQSISSINLSIDGSSNTVPIYSSSNPGNLEGLSAVVAQSGGLFEQISGAYKKGNEVYKNFDAFQNTALQIADGQTSSSEYKSPGILNAISNIASGASTGNPIAIAAGLLSLVNTFSGSSGSTTISSYSSNHEFQAEGTEVSTSPHQPAHIYVPGSDIGGYPNEIEPIYNNILGIASIVETPKYDRIIYIESDWDDCQGGEFAFHYVREEYYKLSEDIKYAINSNAGINNTPSNAKVSMYFDITYSNGCSISDDQLVEEYLGDNDALIKVNNRLYRTPYMNLSCLKEYPVTILTGIYSDCISQGCGQIRVNPYIKLALTLESYDNKEIGYLKSYNMENIIPSYGWEYKPINLFLDIPEDLEINYTDITNETETWGTTTVSDPPSKTFVIENEDGSSSIYSLDTDNDPGTPVVYTTEDFAIDCGEVLPLTALQLSAFCNSTKYNPIVALNVYDKNEKNISEVKSFLISPNPGTDILNIEGIDNVEYLYSIYSSQGTLITEGKLINNQIDINSISNGVYFLQLQTIDKSKIFRHEKFIKL